MKKTGVCLGMVLALLLSACTTTHYRNRADEETYQIIERKSPAVPGMAESFTIEQDTEWDPLAELPVMQESSAALGTAAESEVGAAIVSLERALEIAVRTNRSYQSRKETLYLSALSLTLQRHNYTPIFSSGASVDYAESQVLASSAKLNDFLKTSRRLPRNSPHLPEPPAI